jgi:hypothetical protein
MSAVPDFWLVPGDKFFMYKFPAVARVYCVCVGMWFLFILAEFQINVPIMLGYHFRACILQLGMK